MNKRVKKGTLVIPQLEIMVERLNVDKDKH